MQEAKEEVLDEALAENQNKESQAVSRQPVP